MLTAPVTLSLSANQVHFATGTRLDEYTLEATSLLCGTRALTRSWAGKIARDTGRAPRLKIEKANPVTCTKCRDALVAMLEA
jgi:hypothetical protein